MSAKIGRDTYLLDAEEEFLQDAILDLRHGETIYVYTKYILEELKKVFNDLEIRRFEFYWRIRNNEVSK